MFFIEAPLYLVYNPNYKLGDVHGLSTCHTRRTCKSVFTDLHYIYFTEFTNCVELCVCCLCSFIQCGLLRTY